MEIRRHIMGILGVVFLAIGGWLLLASGSASQMSGVGIKVGLVLIAMWLAFPQVESLTKRVPAWLIGIIVVAGLVIAVRPRAIIFIAPMLVGIALLQFIGWLFKPLPNPKRTRQPKTTSKSEQ